MKRDSKLTYIEWDMKTITPGDYSQEYEISKKSYEWFLNNVYNPIDSQEVFHQEKASRIT
jgi:hypothetical protein